MVCKCFYQNEYLDDVLVVLKEEEDLIEDARVLQTLNNIKSCNFKSGLYTFTSAWKDVKITALSNCWRKWMLNQHPEMDSEGFLPQDFYQIFLCTGETDITIENVESWFDNKGADPGYQVLLLAEIARYVVNESDSSSSSESEEEVVVVRPKMDEVHDSIATFLKYVDVTANQEVQGYYQHCTLRELIIHEQHQSGKQ